MQHLAYVVTLSERATSALRSVSPDAKNLTWRQQADHRRQTLVAARLHLSALRCEQLVGSEVAAARIQKQ